MKFSIYLNRRVFVMKVKFYASKTGLSTRVVFFTSRSKAVPLSCSSLCSLCVDSIICNVRVAFICSSSLLLLLPREGCA